MGADGRRRPRSFETERDALGYIAAFRGQADARTIQVAVDAYLQNLRDRKLRASTVTRQEYQLRLMLHLEENGPRYVRWLTPARGDALYERARTAAAVDTHRNALSVAKAWGRFCVKSGWLRADPFAEVVGIGRRRRGKEQPRVDESRILFDHCLSVADRDPAAVALVTILLLGTRSSEVVQRDVRDLDDGGRLLWIPDAKTQAGRRTVEVPAAIRPYLVALAAGKTPHAPLFVNEEGERADRHWMRYHALRLAKATIQQHVTPQAYRGLHGTLARIDGSTAEAVARQLGHASTAITEGGAYIDRDVVAEAERRAHLKLIAGGRS